MGPLYQPPKQSPCVPHHPYPRLVLWEKQLIALWASGRWGERARNPGIKVSGAKPWPLQSLQETEFSVCCEFQLCHQLSQAAQCCSNPLQDQSPEMIVLPHPSCSGMCWSHCFTACAGQHCHTLTIPACYLCRSDEPRGWRTSAPQMELTLLRLAMGKELFCALLVQICPEMPVWADSFNGR